MLFIVRGYKTVSVFVLFAHTFFLCLLHYHFAPILLGKCDSFFIRWCWCVVCVRRLVYFIFLAYLICVCVYLQAQAALMYDAVFVLVEALNNVLKKKPDQFRAYTARRGIQQTIATNTLNSGGHGRALDCNMTMGWINHWEHGDKISRLLRKVIFLFCLFARLKPK